MQEGCATRWSKMDCVLHSVGSQQVPLSREVTGPTLSLGSYLCNEDGLEEEENRCRR